MTSFDSKAVTEACAKWLRKELANTIAVVDITGKPSSTIVTALCAKAIGPERVLGVIIQDGAQFDAEKAREAIRRLKINSVEVNDAKRVTDALADLCQSAAAGAKALDWPYLIDNTVIVRNAQQTILRTLAQNFQGVIVGTQTLSDLYIDYNEYMPSDLDPVINLTMSEVIRLGKELGLPKYFLAEQASDSPVIRSALDDYIRCGIWHAEDLDFETRRTIDFLHIQSLLKHRPNPAFQYNFEQPVTE